MARSNFEACLDEVFRHEGGYVDHPADPGGATNMGITHRTLAAWRGRPVSKDDVRALSRTEAAAIYRALYWDKVRGDDLPDGLDLVTFDPAVNSGVSRGAGWLQRALGVTADGRVGPVTLGAAASAEAVATIKRACEIRMGFLTGLRTWGTFGRGWSRRVASVEAVSVRMALAAAGATVRPTLVAESGDAHRRAQRDAQAASGVGAGGATAAGGGASIADLPFWGLVGIVIGVALVVIVLIGRRRHQKDRAEAYQRAAEEARP